MSATHFYEVKVDWTDNRRGKLTSPVLNDSVDVATPPEFSKGMAGIWSPEHLLVAAVNSCLMTTFLAVAENSKLEFSKFSSNATGKLETIEGKYMISEIELRASVTIRSEDDREKAIRILQKSEAACLISNSVKSKIIFHPEITVEAVDEVNSSAS